MVTLKECCFVLMYALCSANGATIVDKNLNNLKRAVDTYNYPVPVVSFQENAKKTLVEMIKSVSPASSQGRYLPPSPTPASNSGAKSPPISVSFNSYEPPASPVQSKPSTTVAPPLNAPAPAPAAAPSTSNSNTSTQKKRPSGGLGGFKYYGGSGSSSSSSDSSLAQTAAAAVASSVQSAQPSKSVTIESAPEKPVQKTLTKEQGYNYPSPKSNRKPSKKEQKLADSKPEESAQGYHYDVGPGVLASNLQAFSSGGSSGGVMGMSYMRQSSPFYSYHVMLD